MSSAPKMLAGSPAGRRPGAAEPSSSPATTPTSKPSTRTPTSNVAATTPNGLARSRSTRGGLSARGSAQRSGSTLSSRSMTSDGDEDARAETASIVEDLKQRLRRSEDTSEGFQREMHVLQARLDDALGDQAKLEETLHENEEKMENFVNDKREATRQRREMESIYEAERAAMTKEREESALREEEMQAIIQRLKSSLTMKPVSDDDRVGRRSNNSSPSLESSQFAPPNGLSRSDSRSKSNLLLQKDKLIEDLRFQVAEIQIRLVEAENRDGGRLQEVERQLTESLKNNARLREDHESYQFLLQEKTLNGDFARDLGNFSSAANMDALNALEGRAPTNLADELSQSEEDPSDVSPEAYRKLESELRASKESNKALTLYINKIIERLLQHQDFEAILDTSDAKLPTGTAGSASIEKDLPPPPPPKDPSAGPSFLERAKSVAMTGANAVRRPRPQSQMPISSTAGHTDPDTAPSIPIGLNRAISSRTGQTGGSRPRSEQFTSAASVVNQMYKGGQTSPPLHGPQTPRHSQSFFGAASMMNSQTTGGNSVNPAAQARRAPNTGPVPTTASTTTNPSSTSSNIDTMSTSGSGAGVRSSSSSSISGGTSGVGASDGDPILTGDATDPTPGASPRPSAGSEKDKVREREGMASFSGGKPRPLRLVRDREEKEREEKAAKRSSWMGWPWGGGGGSANNTPTNVVTPPATAGATVTNHEATSSAATATPTAVAAGRKASVATTAGELDASIPEDPSVE